jgi:hypothetical protein
LGNPYAVPGQPQPGGWPGPQQHYPQPQPQPQYRPSTGRRTDNDKGFFGALFDFSFDNFIAPKLVKFLFVISLIGVTIYTVVMIIAGFAMMSEAGGAKAAGVLLVALSPIAWFIGLIVIRLYLELAIVMFKISDDIKDIRDNGAMNR